MTRCISFFLFLFLVFAAVPVAAQGESDVSALNNKAVQLSKDGEYMQAIDVWLGLIESVDGEHEYLWAFHMSVGRNFQKLHMFPEAWWHLNRCVELTKGQQEGPVEWLTEVEVALKAGYRKVVVVIGAAGGEVKQIHGTRSQWYKAPVTWWFKPGTQVLTVRAKGHAEREMAVKITQDTSDVVLTLEEKKELKSELIVVVDQAEAEILIGGKVMGKGRVERSAKPGTYEVSARLAGFKTWSKKLTIIEGRTVQENVTLQQAVPQGDGPVPLWKWLVAGSGVVVAGAGGVTYMMAGSSLDDQKSEYSQWLKDEFGLNGKVPNNAADKEKAQTEWDDRVQSNVKPMEYMSYALWGIGGAVAVTGLVLALTHDTGGESSAQYLPVIAPIYVRDGAGIGAAFYF